jgi:hypothetical protein
LSLLTTGFTSTNLAQTTPTDCPTLVNDALTNVGQACANLGRNQVCYGNNQVFAFGADSQPLADFALAGDIKPVVDVSSLQTTPLNTENNLWGVAVLSLQANIPGTLPGQNVTFVVFGDSTITADPDAAGDGLNAPMQAFRIATGIGEPQCAEAPHDGILVQSPGKTKVNFRVNGVDVEIGSTIIMDVRGDERVWISTLEGEAKVTSAGETRVALPGYIVVTTPGNPPDAPEPYTFSEVAAMPVNLLPESVIIPFIVPALEGTNDWLISDFAVKAGTTYAITAAGEVDIYPACETELQLPEGVTCDDMRFGPEGSVNLGTAPAGYPLPDANIGAVVARLGDDGDPFLIGIGTQYTPEEDGVLQFRLNDTTFADDNVNGFVILVRAEPDAE